MYYHAAALIPKALETEYKRRKTQVTIGHSYQYDSHK